MGALVPTACRSSSDGRTPTSQPDTVGVVVSVLPQAFLAERVGGAHVRVTVLVGPGQSPHVFEPSQRQMAALSDARLYFTTALPFERVLADKLAPMFTTLRMVDTTRDIPLRPVTPCDHGHEDGGPDSHAHGDPDPHVWLNPKFALRQAATMAAALREIDPAHAADYDRNLATLTTEINRVDERVAAALAPFKGRPFFVFHPAYGYFADRYGLVQVPVEEGGKEPSPRQLAALIDRAKQVGVRLVFVQPQFPTKSAEAVAQAIGGAVLPLDDLAPDYLANLDDMATKIARSMTATASAESTPRRN